jgi:hypothetical protein
MIVFTDTKKRSRGNIRQADSFKRISNCVCTADAIQLEAIYRQKLTDLGELKKSILQKVFTGTYERTDNILICHI